MALARLESRVALEETLARFPEWDVDLNHAERFRTTSVRGTDVYPSPSEQLAPNRARITSERLGHASVGFTLDTYGHVLPGQQAEVAAAVAKLVDG